jgi:hypothetical protein
MTPPPLSQVFPLKQVAREPQGGGSRDRIRVPHPPDDHLNDPLNQELSKAFGWIERSINEVKRACEELPVDREVMYRLLDDLQDHTTEIFRHVVDEDPMVRWVRRTDPSQAQSGLETEDGDGMVGDQTKDKTVEPGGLHLMSI